MPNNINYVQHIFPAGRNILWGRFAPVLPVPLATALGPYRVPNIFLKKNWYICTKKNHYKKACSMRVTKLMVKAKS